MHSSVIASLEQCSQSPMYNGSDLKFHMTLNEHSESMYPDDIEDTTGSLVTGTVHRRKPISLYRALDI